MIYGYRRRQITDEGLLEMQEVSISAEAATLREVAKFLIECADRIENESDSINIMWHVHPKESIDVKLDCSLVVLGPPEYYQD